MILAGLEGSYDLTDGVPFYIFLFIMLVFGIIAIRRNVTKLLIVVRDQTFVSDLLSIGFFFV
jgi:hypothetical protein